MDQFHACPIWGPRALTHSLRVVRGLDYMDNKGEPMGDIWAQQVDMACVHGMHGEYLAHCTWVLF